MVAHEGDVGEVDPSLVEGEAAPEQRAVRSVEDGLDRPIVDPNAFDVAARRVRPVEAPSALERALIAMIPATAPTAIPARPAPPVAIAIVRWVDEGGGGAATTRGLGVGSISCGTISSAVVPGIASSVPRQLVREGALASTMYGIPSGERADVEHARDVLALDPHGRAGFAEKPRDRIRVGRDVRTEQLDRDPLAEDEVLRREAVGRDRPRGGALLRGWARARSCEALRTASAWPRVELLGSTDE